MIYENDFPLSFIQLKSQIGIIGLDNRHGQWVLRDPNIRVKPEAFELKASSITAPKFGEQLQKETLPR